ncbi:MAG: CHC2 zinc finger domain-containing protein [Candidatus Brocadiaceae bacterium]|nr:CHC2 zinc finger domain-containing protein [Candidatus Brocadiaceae bacterium]
MYSVIQTAKDFGVDVQWAVARRKEYLNQKIGELKNEQSQVLQAFSGNNELNRFLLLDSMRILDKEIKKYESDLNFKNSRNDNRITQNDIERAKQFSLENLLQNIRNGKAHCVSGNHMDKHPSMSIKNNFAYCYSCGWHGDVIDVYMKINSVGFVTAVKTLKPL